MEFSPAFYLLPKFSIDFVKSDKSDDDLRLVCRYLGVDLVDAKADVRASILRDELLRQNAFLTKQIDLETIYDTDEYRRSSFIQEIVANNRANRKKRASPDR